MSSRGVFFLELKTEAPWCVFLEQKTEAPWGFVFLEEEKRRRAGGVFPGAENKGVGRFYLVCVFFLEQKRSRAVCFRLERFFSAVRGGQICQCEKGNF